MQEFTIKKSNLTIKTQVNAIVESDNRVGVMPTVNGRLEELYVKEGDKVECGQILAKVSSSERTALLDSIKTSSYTEYERKIIEESYKLTPVVSPINGTVIKIYGEVGQSVSVSKEILVISHKLIIKAFVDEIDIGKIKEGQDVEYYLDSFPELILKGKVASISLDSVEKNGVNVYEVKIIPIDKKEILRSGMNANVNILTGFKKNAITIPKKAITYISANPYVKIKENDKLKDIQITLGDSDENMIEVKSGLEENMKIYYSTHVKEESFRFIN